jgi:hypothetical protein
MRPAKYFYDKPLPKYLDPKTVLIYCPQPVCHTLVPKTDRKNRWYWSLNSPLCILFLEGVVCLERVEEGVCPTLESKDA